MSQDNRPSLPRFNYRIGTYGSIREFLFHQLDQTPALQSWTHRAPDDPAVALMEGASVLGDILTFYQETYANEAFLRTAQWRESIADLVRWLGYRLSPGVGGKAVFVFEIKKHEPVLIPARFPLKAALEHFDKPAEFETAGPVTAYPWLNRFNLYRPLEDRDITPATTEFYISAPEQLLFPVALKPGERLMIGESSANWPAQPMVLTHAEVVIVDAVRQLHGTQIIKIKGNLQRLSQVPQLAAYRIARTFHHFGHNGQEQIVDPSEPVTSTSTVTTGSHGSDTETSSTIPYLDVPSSRPIRVAAGMFSDPAISRSITLDEFPLDVELTDLPAKVPIIIQARFAHPFAGDASQMFDPPPELRTLVRTIKEVGTTTLSWGAITGTVSEITVAEAISDSIEADDPGAIAAASQAWHDAEAHVITAAGALAAARAAARTARVTADAAAAASARADADVIAKAAKAIAARADAATMAVAAQVAAAALKDNATDASTELARQSAVQALTLADDAKAKTATAAAAALLTQGFATSAAIAADSQLTATYIVSALHLWLDVPVDGLIVFGGLTAAAATTTKVSVDATTASIGIAKLAVDQTRDKVSEAKTRAEAAREDARLDADATLRSQAANETLRLANVAVGAAELAESDARIAATTALNTATSTATLAATAADRVKPAADALALAKKKAASKKVVKDTRMYVKDALFHEVTSPLVTLKRAKEETTAPLGRILNFEGTANQVMALKDRRIMIARTGVDAEILTVRSVPSVFDPATADYPRLYPIDLSADVPYGDFPNQNPLVAVFGNLADATEGKTLAEMSIGSGDANQIFQTFKLPKAPLTYHIVPDNTPSETPQVAIYVDGREWKQVDSFFGRGKDDPLYIVREDAAGTSWVQFGDGKTGSRLSAGVNNVSAVYRIGDGAYGPLKAETKVQASARLKNLGTIWMPADVTGGAPPESGENARTAAPGKVQSLGRLVSLRDFEAEAAAIPGVASAAASWQLSGDIPAVEMTVLMETGRGEELDKVEETLNIYNIQRGAGRDPVSVAEGKRLYVAATVEYALKPTFRQDTVEAEIRRALGVNYAGATREENQTGLFSLGRRRFGGPEYASSIAGRVQNVEGVLWARTAALTTLSDVDDPATIVPSSSVLDPVVACDSRHILSLYDTHLTLTPVDGDGSLRMATNTRVELYRRLPEIYRIKDEDLPKLYLQDGQPVPAYQLKKYLEPAEDMFSAIHENIESLYHDLFIEYLRRVGDSLHRRSVRHDPSVW